MWWRRSRRAEDFKLEIDAHLQLETDRFIADGLSPDDARAAARRAFGNVTRAEERFYESRRVMWLDDLRSDTRYAIRTLIKSPGFTIAAALTLAIGIGANTAIFSVIRGVILRPLPYHDPQKLVSLVENVPAAENFTGQPQRLLGIRIDEFTQWQTRFDAFSHTAVYVSTQMTLTTPDESTRLLGVQVSSAMFPMLGAQTILGRVFDAAAERAHSDAVIVLSSVAWRTHFGANPDIVGRTVTLDGQPYSVIGIMRPDFQFPDRQTQFWVPFVPTAMPGVRIVPMLGRLKDSVSIALAEADANRIGGQIRGISWPSEPSLGVPRFQVVRLHDELIGSVRSALFILMGAVGFVLLVACANVASLVLARTISRQREMAIRVALGAGRSRLLRQLFTESLVLAVTGGVAATAFAFGALQALKAVATVNAPRWLLGTNGDRIIPRIDGIGIDGVVLAFATCASVLTVLLFGWTALLHTSRVSHLRTATPTDGWGWRAGRSRRLLVTTQVALATVLLIGAGLLLRSFTNLLHVNTGYNPTGVLTFQVSLPGNVPRLTFAHDLVQRLQSVATVRTAGFTNMLPLSPGSWLLNFQIVGAAPDLLRQRPPQTRYVSQTFLNAMGVRLVEGRWFGERDGSGQPRVVIVNRSLARAFGDQSPVGKTITGIAARAWEVIGVVEDVRQGRLDVDPAPQFYIDFRQLPTDSSLPPMPSFMPLFFAARIDGDFTAAVSSIRGLVRQLEPRAALDSVAGMEQLVSSSIARPRFYAVLVAIFAVIAVALAAIGIFGVLQYSVAQRTREIGIRMALGAPRREVIRLVLRQVSMAVGLGLTLGLGGAAAVTRYLKAMLFGLTPLDPATFILVVVSFVIVAAIAAYVPARSATTVDPVVALRNE